MQTTDKALGLLNHFSEARPAIGLSEIARLSGFNKATARRFLLALMKHGFVEQEVTSKAYRLGPGLLRLARVREAVTPVTAVVQPVLEDLVSTFGETAHFSLYDGESLGTIGLVQSARSNRVMLESGEAIPLHATASGLAYLAFARPAVVDAALKKSLRSYTECTTTDPDKIRQLLISAGKRGVAVVKGTYEDGVCGIASPVFSSDGYASGAVAVAAPVSRAQRKIIASMQPELRRAATEITLAMGAKPHAAISRAHGVAVV
jgi:DNA-binding IclR family transcriptional regulator